MGGLDLMCVERKFSQPKMHFYGQWVDIFRRSNILNIRRLIKIIIM